MDDADFSLLLDLPDDWQDRYIPTSEEYYERTCEKLAELRERVEASHPFPSEQLLEEIYEVVHLTSDFPQSIELLVEFVLQIKPFILRAGRNDIWYALLTNLYANVMDHIKDFERRSQVLSVLATHIGMTAMLTSYKTPEEIFKNAIGFGLEGDNAEDWLLASSHFMEYKAVSQPLEGTLREGAQLLVLAERYKSRMAEILILWNQAYACFHYGDYDRCFAYAQQSFVLAYSLNQVKRALLALGLMMSIRTYNKRLLPYTLCLIKFWQQQREHLEFDLYLEANFCGHLGTLLYENQQYIRATKYLRVSSELFHRMDDRGNAGRLSQALGLTLTRLERYIEAEVALEKAIAEYDAVGNIINQAWAMYTLGWSIRKSGDYQRAFEVLLTALQTAQDLPPSQQRTRLIADIQEELAKTSPSRIN